MVENVVTCVCHNWSQATLLSPREERHLDPGPCPEWGSPEWLSLFLSTVILAPPLSPVNSLGFYPGPMGDPVCQGSCLCWFSVGCTKCTKCELCKMGAHEGDGEEARKGRVSQCSPVTGPLTLPRANQSLMTLCNQFSLHQCHPQVHGHTRPSSSSNGR